jgi:hypothetical protein
MIGIEGGGDNSTEVTTETSRAVWPYFESTFAP